ncbi:MAG: radical SAM protein, partial [Deltaproteobacteria bacterium]|nr:radical SAM protein [Deltaproteobacteria bacterium]
MGKATNIVKRGARALLGEGAYIGLRNCYRRAWLPIWNLLFTATRHRARFWRAVKLLDSESYCAPATPHRPPFPGYAVVEINNTCNINCLMCDTASARRQKGVIDIGLLERVLAELKQRGIRSVDVHTIGDPLANPKLPAVLAVFRKLRMTPGLSTNGLLIKKHLKTLIEYRDVTSLIRLSIDGATKPTYERIRAGGKWEDLMENLTIASNELVPRGFTLTSNMVVSEDNVSEAGLFVEVFRPFVMPSNMQFSFVNSLAPDTSYFHRVNLFPNHTVPNRPCSLPFSSFWVHLDGRVSSCCRDYHGEVI